MVSGLPAWATEPPFDPALGWLLIVCTGGAGALGHPFEPLGIYFEQTPGDWSWRSRQDGDPENGYTRCIVPSREGVELVRDASGNVVGSRNTGAGSIVATCPRCGRSPRVARADWPRFLEAARVSGAPVASTSVLE